MIKLYGNPYSRANRVRWALEEAGVDYQEEEIALGGEGTRSAKFLKINPNGHVPVLDDDGLVLFESVPIALYIAKKYGTEGLYPVKVEQEGEALQWGVWAITELERYIETAALHCKWLPEAMRNADKAAAAQAKAKRCLPMISDAIGSSGHLVGDGFTIADIIVTEVLTNIVHSNIDVDDDAAIGEYLKSNLSRPSASAAFQPDIIEPFL